MVEGGIVGDNHHKEFTQKVERFMMAFRSRVVGQSDLGMRLFMAMIADGHVLLEGLPGLAKTTAIKTVAALTGVQFSRIQFTPDLLPADVIGTQIYDPRTSSFHIRKGPIFANLVLADEINRSPAKVQSALLEAMGEHQVTIAGESFALDSPFLVMATQNPIEQEGTYVLPEAQVDRFMFKVVVRYGSREDEMEILRTHRREGFHDALAPVFSREDILEARKAMGAIGVSEKIYDYIVRLVFATREPQAFKLESLKPWIEVGASPRATIYLERAARVHALMRGQEFVTPSDVKAIAYDVLRHRLTTSFVADAEGISRDHIVQKILETVPVI